MKNSLLSFVLATAVALAPMGSSAQTGVVLTGKGVTPQAGQTVKTVEGIGGSASYTPSTIVDPMPSKTEGMQNNAQDASSKQGSGKAAALAALAAMLGVMAATCPACGVRGTCPTCIASTIGAAASGLTAGNMSGAQKLSNQQKTDVNPTLKPEAYVDEFADGDTSVTAKKINKALEKSGLKVSPDLKSVTTSDGRNLNTASAFTGGAGMSSSELNALKDVKAKAQDAAAKAALAGKDAVASDGESVGGGGKGSGSSSETSTVAANGFAVKRDPAAVAGAFKDFNGDRIGVASDSMFSMIKRRYVFEADKKSFVIDK
jgi:hypothetical protein